MQDRGGSKNPKQNSGNHRRFPNIDQSALHIPLPLEYVNCLTIFNAYSIISLDGAQWTIIPNFYLKSSRSTKHLRLSIVPNLWRNGGGGNSLKFFTGKFLPIYREKSGKEERKNEEKKEKKIKGKRWKTENGREKL